MDQLCKFILQHEYFLYKYRGKVKVHPLQVVDDVITAGKSGSTTNALNAAVNAFMDLKKLKLGVDKCANVYVGNKETKLRCNIKQVHGENMKNSENKKYLGDFVTTR